MPHYTLVYTFKWRNFQICDVTRMDIRTFTEYRTVYIYRVLRKSCVRFVFLIRLWSVIASRIKRYRFLNAATYIFCTKSNMIIRKFSKKKSAASP